MDATDPTTDTSEPSPLAAAAARRRARLAGQDVPKPAPPADPFAGLPS